MLPFHGVGDLQHHPHTMTAFTAEFAEPSGHYQLTGLLAELHERSSKPESVANCG
jgi:hypothetical protein